MKRSKARYTKRGGWKDEERSLLHEPCSVNDVRKKLENMQLNAAEHIFSEPLNSK